MYRRLEPKSEKILAKESKADTTCICTCKSEKSSEGEPQAATTKSGNQLKTHYDING